MRKLNKTVMRPNFKVSLHMIQTSTCQWKKLQYTELAVKIYSRIRIKIFCMDPTKVYPNQLFGIKLFCKRHKFCILGQLMTWNWKFVWKTKYLSVFSRKFQSSFFVSRVLLMSVFIFSIDGK